MNVIIGLLKTVQDPINTTRAGKADMRSERQIILTDLENTRVMKMSKRCLKVTTNVLIGTIQLKLKTFEHIPLDTKQGNVKSLECLTVEC